MIRRLSVYRVFHVVVLGLAAGPLRTECAHAQLVTRLEAGQSAEASGKDTRSGDRAAVRAAMAAFVKAFEAADARALAAHWTDEGEYVREGEGTIRGRQALEKNFAEFFAKSPKVKVEVETESVRFLSRDNALEEGVVAVRTSPAEPTVDVRYHALFVREDGQWRLALLREWPGDDEDSLRDLDWLVGDWKSTEKGVDIVSSYSWAPGKKFLRVEFSVKEKDRQLSGFQVLGKDPASHELRAWTFEAEGGVAEAVWKRDGEHWTAEATGTLVDGRTLTATNILRRINDDAFTWQSINRKLDGADLPDLPPTKVSRIKK